MAKVFGMEVRIISGMPNNMCAVVSPKRGPADLRTDAERSVLIINLQEKRHG